LDAMLALVRAKWVVIQILTEEDGIEIRENPRETSTWAQPASDGHTASTADRIAGSLIFHGKAGSVAIAITVRRPLR